MQTQAQAQAQAQQFLFHSENGLDAGISTSAKASSKIKICPFSCACAYACDCATASENEIPLRRNTSTRVLATRVYVWPVKTLVPHYLAPKQFVFGWFCLCLCLHRISLSLGSSLLLAQWKPGLSHFQRERVKSFNCKTWFSLATQDKHKQCWRILSKALRLVLSIAYFILVHMFSS